MKPASRQRRRRNNVTPNSAYLSRQVCGLSYATVELCFLRCPWRGYITRVPLQLRRVLAEFRGSMVVEDEIKEDFKVI
jgi:hypothetical protein